jgi:hypothetical protein
MIRITMKKNVLLSLLILICSMTRINAQSPYFYPMDENFELIQDFYKTDTILVVFPDSEPMSFKDKQDVENFIFWGKKPDFIFKKESDLVPKDLEKHLQIYGAIFKFKNSYSKLPIRVSGEYFSYKTESFHKSNDAFYYLTDNAKVLYTCRNKQSTLNPFLIYGIGAYQFYLFSNNEIYYSGYVNPYAHSEKVNDIRKLKKDYFHEKSTLFYDLNVAKAINIDSLYNILSDTLDKYVINLCNSLDVDTSNIDNMKLYIYADRIELQRFIAAPMWSTVWGKCMGNVLHTCNGDIATIKHETAHSIISQKIGYYSNSLFDEGFRQYTEYLFNKDAYDSDLEITKKHFELLKEELLKGDNSFFNNQLNYSISGVFTKYIIDKIGFPEFKIAFSQRMIENYLNKKYNITIEELFEEFKNSL